ncbi:MAG: class I SAM-dependent methyltransferase [Candidatus Kerfeldbacteria bacterium]
MINLLILFLLLIGILIIFGTAMYASFSAAPWLPVFKKDIKRIIRLANLKPGEVIYDLGSGDGRVLIGLANNSEASRVIGYEISFLFYVISYLRILFLGLSNKAEIIFGDFLRRDLSNADVIFFFLTPMAMKKLKPKFEKELKKGTRIISYSFSIPGWEKLKVDRPNESDMPIHIYVVD